MPAQQSTLLFQVAARGLSRRRLRAFAERLAREVAGGRGFCCLIAGDKELQRLNREFRGRDYPTDVLSFPARNSKAGGLPRGGGDIAISFEAARRQAAEYGHDVDRELEILMLHGLLHLLGMDHETDRGRMASAERKWRVRLGLPEGLIQRVGA
jgi:probable rRNA maturation factor